MQHGFNATTAAYIAVATGVTSRTVFRYFGHKREIPFAWQERLRELYRTAILDALDRSLIDLIAAGLHAATLAYFPEKKRKFSTRCHAGIARYVEL